MSEATVKRLYNAGIGRETTRGVKVTPQFWLQSTKFDIQDHPETLKTERQRGNVVLHGGQEVVKNVSSGQIETDIFDKSSPIFFYGVLGSISSVETIDSGVYLHTMDLLQSSVRPTFTVVEKRGSVEQVAYRNSVVSTLALKFDLNQYATLTATMRGKGQVADTSTPAYIDEHVYLAKNVTVKLADTYAGLDAGTAYCVKMLNMEFKNTMTDDECLGNNEPRDFLAGPFELTGTIEIYFTGVYERDWAIENTIKAMRITLEDTDVVIGASSHPSITIDMPKVQFGEPEISSELNAITKIVIKFEAYYDNTEDFIVNVFAKNTQVSY